MKAKALDLLLTQLWNASLSKVILISVSEKELAGEIPSANLLFERDSEREREREMSTYVCMHLCIFLCIQREREREKERERERKKRDRIMCVSLSHMVSVSSK